MLPDPSDRTTRSDDVNSDIAPDIAPDISASKAAGSAADAVPHAAPASLTGNRPDDLQLPDKLRLQLFEVAASMARIGYWKLDFHTSVVWWSDEVFRIHGYAPQSFQPTLDIGVDAYHPDDQEKVGIAIQNSQETGENFQFSLRIMRPSGEVRYVKSYGLCEIADDGAVTGMFGIFVDETETHLMNTSLIEQRTRLELAVNAGGFGIWEYDIADGFLQWNDQMFEIFAVAPDTHVTRDTWENCLHPDDRDETVKALDNTLMGGALFDSIFRTKRPNGDIRYIKANATVLRDPDTGEAMRMIGVNYDMTLWHQSQEAMQNAIEEQETASRMKSEFLAKMTHEIRTPMNGLIGMLELIQADSMTDDQSNKLDLALASARHLLTILNDTLDFSRLESGATTTEAVAFDPRDMVDNVVSLLRPTAHKKALTIRAASDKSLPNALISDVTKIRQIVMNLVNNAIKFTDQGSISIDTRFTQTTEQRGHLIISVQDTGIGISAAAQKGLFEQFYQGDNSISRRFGGTGLGLAISRGFAELLEGNLTVNSAEGEGACFTLTVPVMTSETTNVTTSVTTRVTTTPVQPDLKAISAADHRGGPYLDLETSPAKAEPVSPQTARDLNILIVEDHPINRAVLLGFLEQHDAEADIAENGHIATKMAASKAYDIILMDIQMPVMDGVTATKTIRQSAGPNADTPIVAVTANALPGDRELYASVGMNDYISKPIDSGEIARVLAEISTAPAAHAVPCGADTPETCCRDLERDQKPANHMAQDTIQPCRDISPDRRAALNALLNTLD